MFKISMLLLACILISSKVMAIEEPSYELIEKSDSFELRAYAPMIVAETRVSGAMDEATSAGFRLIADYIFGNNQTDSGSSQEISMTAPVTVEPQSQQIDMTAPVTMAEEDGQWRVHFVMPGEYSMESLPKPNNDAVTLRQVAAANYAVIRFSGFTGEKKVAKKTRKLKEWMLQKGLKPKGEPELARYNHPLTLPFMRRNEVMVRY